LTLTDSSDPLRPTEASQGPIENPPATASIPPDGNSEVAATAEQSSAAADQAAAHRRILIGSQRDPAAYRARQKRDWAPVDEAAEKPKKRRNRKGDGGRVKRENEPQATAARPANGARSAPQAPTSASAAFLPAGKTAELPQQVTVLPSAPSKPPLPAPALPPVASPLAPPPPSLHIEPLSALDVEAELDRAMSDASIDELLGGGSQTGEEIFEADSLQSGRVVAVRRDDVFIEFAGRQQGIVSLRQFDVPPRPGAVVQVIVQRLNPEDGLYELSMPNKAVQVDDWSDLVEGALVEVRVTGHNTGGLECEVNHIRGFIPVSQVSLYRVEDLIPYTDQRLTCVITEADPERRNLVLSRRAVLEREKEQLRDQMLNSLCPGQIHDGVVRKLMDFGAFVDIGGIDGLLHVSQLAWGRVKHPSDVLKEGQTIKVRVEKVDPTTGKISLAYRDLLESPWTTVAQKFPPHSIAHGTVTKLMDFGAFVELEPGIEGLVHVSELSPKRVWRPAEVVKEGEEVDVLVLSVDAEAQRISLSIKALATPAEPVRKDDSADQAPAKPSKKAAKPTGPLRGGLSRSGGDRFGLKW
jgi:small subunit ribosomal protein S1